MKNIRIYDNGGGTDSQIETHPDLTRARAIIAKARGDA